MSTQQCTWVHTSTHEYASVHMSTHREVARDHGRGNGKPFCKKYTNEPESKNQRAENHLLCNGLKKEPTSQGAKEERTWWCLFIPILRIDNPSTMTSGFVAPCYCLWRRWSIAWIRLDLTQWKEARSIAQGVSTRGLPIFILLQVCVYLASWHGEIPSVGSVFVEMS